MKQLFLLVITVLFIACNNNSKYSKLPEQQQAPQPEVPSLVVSETIDAGGYTYVRGTKGEEEMWLAIPKTTLEVGQTVYFTNGMEMKDFHSKELDRTFDKILFLEGVSLQEKTVVKLNQEHKSGEPEKAAQERPPLPQISLPEDVISIEDIYTKRNEFEGKSVSVYGVVWKVNNGILDRNWVHIEDGTSTEDKSSLTITTQETIKVGDTIKMKGKLVLDKDFGYGYVYDVLLEESTMIK